MKEETYTYTLTREQAQQATAGAQLLVQIAGQQIEKVPNEKLDEFMAGLKRNRTLVEMFAAPLIAADEKKAKGHEGPPAANPKKPRARK